MEEKDKTTEEVFFVFFCVTLGWFIVQKEKKDEKVFFLIGV